MLTRDFSYDLPQDLIAQEPPAERGTSRMMVLHRDDGRVEHRRVTDLPEYLRADDLLVLNDTRVFPARIRGTWADTGGALELLLLEPLPPPQGLAAEAGETALWNCITGSGRPIRPGHKAVFAGGLLHAEPVSRRENGTWDVLLRSGPPLMDVLEQHGLPPVPPYIHRNGDARQARLDRERYQTVYAKNTGAVAAPTAGLHFTDALLASLAAKGVNRTTLTLHVGPGTFKPVKADTVEAHRMDPERYTVPQETADAVAACRTRGGRVVAVGSTSVRTLETVAAANGGRVVAASGASSIFIYPPYRFLATDVMLTNFHLPQSTLIMMVSALAGHDRIMAAYREAVRERYRFFSYGDCMLIL
jgi:S-adenosylmethionine:tRNA ribosyltransferase-isomerase